MSEIKRLFARMKRELGFSKDCLSTDMLVEIDRLGLSCDWFDRLVKQEGLEFASFCLYARSKEAALFEKWFARTMDFVAECREKNPFPDSGNLSFHERASLSVLCDKVRDAEHVPCFGNHMAAFFTAPLHALRMLNDCVIAKKIGNTAVCLHWQRKTKMISPRMSVWLFVVQPVQLSVCDSTIS